MKASMLAIFLQFFFGWRFLNIADIRYLYARLKFFFLIKEVKAEKIMFIFGIF